MVTFCGFFVPFNLKNELLILDLLRKFWSILFFLSSGKMRMYLLSGARGMAGEKDIYIYIWFCLFDGGRLASHQFAILNFKTTGLQRG